MDDDKKQEVREAIRKAIGKTEKAIAGYEEASQPISPENSIGRVSRMDAINNKSVVEAALRKAQEKLKGLRYMEKQIDADGFGQCKRCGQEIPIQRMLLMPDSQYCVRCAR